MKKNISKLAAIFLAVVMIISAVPSFAFADESESRSVQAATSGIDPNSSVSASEAVVDVNIEWGDLNFVYNFGTVWNPTTHSYDAAEGEKLGWDHTSTDIKVTNNSNVPVYTTISFEKYEGTAFDSVDCDFNKNDTTLDSALDGESHSDIFVFSIFGKPDEACTEGTEFGIITVSFTAVIEQPTEQSTEQPTEQSNNESGGYYYGGSRDGQDNDT